MSRPGFYGAAGGFTESGVWSAGSRGPLTKLAPPSLQMGPRWGAGVAALPMRGTTQDRLQGLRAQHLVPWGQFSSLTQEIVQESSEEELSSGHTACPAHRMGRWVGGGRIPSPLGLLRGKQGGARTEPPGGGSPAPSALLLGRKKSARNVTRLTKV